MNTEPKSLPEGMEHGTAAAYSSRGCRCDTCREAHAVKCAAGYQDRRRRFDAGEVDVPHGTVNTYAAWGCRCDLCREASRVYNRGRNRGRNKTPQPEPARPMVWAASRPVVT